MPRFRDQKRYGVIEAELAAAAIPCYSRDMRRSASRRDVAHFAAIAAVEAETEEQRFAHAARTPPGERILTGLRLGAQLPLTPALLAEIDACTDGQMELARRRVALALVRLRRP